MVIQYKCIRYTDTEITFIFTLDTDFYRCDGYKDCKDGSDEDMCDIVCLITDEDNMIKAYNDLNMCQTECWKHICKCSHMYFQCGSGECVHSSSVCNQKSDCIDNSDEELCSNLNIIKGNNVFVCNDKSNIPANKVNDFIPDCPGLNAEDEEEYKQFLANRLITIHMDYQCAKANHFQCVKGNIKS